MNASEEQQVRQYLLGSVSQAEREQLELKLLLDDEFIDTVEMMEDELIEDYVAGQLAEMEHKRFERYFLCTPERQQKLRLSKALWRYANPKKESEPVASAPPDPREVLPKPEPSRWLSEIPMFWKMAAGILLTVGLGIGTWRMWFSQSEASQAIASLQKAYSKERPIESRITEFDYAPFDPYRGNEQVTGDQILKQRAERILLDAIVETASSENKHALGRFYLAEKKLDQAITQLTEALAGDTRNAGIQSDLGAAWLEQGKLHRLSSEESKSLESFARSLEYLNQSLQQQPGAKEALFNRALCYQYMKLYPQATQDWKEYLQLDPNSEWAKEAQTNLALIEKEQKKTAESREKLYENFLHAQKSSDDESAWQALRQSYTTRGNYIVERLIDEHLAGSSAASLPLNLLAYAGRLAVARVHDYHWQELANFYQRATLIQRADVVEARQHLREGNERISNSRSEAIRHYEKALALFRKARDEGEAGMANYLLGKTHLRQANFVVSAAIFTRLAQPNNRYKWLQCQADYALADLQSSLSESSQAIHYSRRAFILAEQIGDAGLAVRSLSQLAEWDQYLGENRRSLVSLQRALVLASTSPMEAMERWILNVRLSDNLAELGYVLAAIEYQKEALRLAEEAKRPLQASRSYSYLGGLLGSQGKSAEAIQSLRKACAIGETLADQTMKQNILGYSLLGLAHQQRKSGHLVEAQDNYKRAIEINQKLGLPYANFDSIRGRLLSEIARQNDLAAQQDLHLALEIFESNRAKITEETKRSSFFDREQDIYDIAIDFAYRNDPQQAFEYSETSRARSLLDLLRNGIAKESKASGEAEIYLAASASPMSLEEIQRQLPEQVKIIQYAALHEHLIIWVISRHEFKSKVVPVSLESLNEKITVYLRLIAKQVATDVEESQKLSAELFKLLIQPIVSHLGEQDRLCFVPDKMLNHLPFGALFSGETGKYLIEQYNLLVSPSANAFLICTDRGKKKSSATEESILSVGNPLFDRSQPETKALPDLPQAEQEAKDIASYYPSQHLFIGNQAKEGVIRKQMGLVEVVHLATHGLTNERSALLSKLLLAKEAAANNPNDEADGVLQAHEIYRLNLRRPKLVVLSACQSGLEKYYRGEGMIGLARPFLVAGVPTVLASLWAVKSEATAKLMTAFHRYRKQKKEASMRALRLAQIELLHSSEPRYRHPYYWASFSLIGGMTTY